MIRSIRGKRGLEGGTSALLGALIVVAIVVILVLSGAGNSIINLFKGSKAYGSPNTIAQSTQNCRTACNSEDARLAYCCSIIPVISQTNSKAVDFLTCDQPPIRPDGCAFTCNEAVDCRSFKCSLRNGGAKLFPDSCPTGATPITYYAERGIKTTSAGDANKICTDQLGHKTSVTGTAQNPIRCQPTEQEIPASDTIGANPDFICCIDKKLLDHEQKCCLIA